MKPFDTEQLAAVEAAIHATKREGHGNLAAISIDKVLAELIREPYEPREGEVFAFSNAITPAHSVDWGFCRKLQGIAFEAEHIRPLRLSEMPRQVEQLRIAMDWFAEAEHIPEFIRKQAQSDRAEFDEAIKP